MIVAAEASGDLLGAEIIREIKSQYKSAEIIGVGGPEMAAAGQNQFFDVSELSVMGLLEIIPHLPRLFKLMQKLVGYAEAEQPDLLLTIDGQDFNKRLAKRIKAKLPIQAMHVVAPTVWAWRAGRAKEYAKIYDHLFTIFPFEATYFEKHGLNCSYIGHPLAHSMASWESKFLQGMP